MEQQKPIDVRLEAEKTESIDQQLKTLANELGFELTDELMALEEQMIALSSEPQNPKTTEQFRELITEYQLKDAQLIDIGPEGYQSHPEKSESLIKIAERLEIAAILFKSGHQADCLEELYDILTMVDNEISITPSDQLERTMQAVTQIYQKVSELLK
jgi:hypothetical protein